MHPVFTAALFTTAKTWKQPKCPSTDDRIKKSIYERESASHSACPTLFDPMDYTVLGILQARTLEWVAVPFSSGSSQPRKELNWGLLHCRWMDSLPTEISGKPHVYIHNGILLSHKKEQNNAICSNMGKGKRSRAAEDKITG